MAQPLTRSGRASKASDPKSNLKTRKQPMGLPAVGDIFEEPSRRKRLQDGHPQHLELGPGGEGSLSSGASSSGCSSVETSSIEMTLKQQHLQPTTRGSLSGGGLEEEEERNCPRVSEPMKAYLGITPTSGVSELAKTGSKDRKEKGLTRNSDELLEQQAEQEDCRLSHRERLTSFQRERKREMSEFSAFTMRKNLNTSLARVSRSARLSGELEVVSVKRGPAIKPTATSDNFQLPPSARSKESRLLVLPERPEKVSQVTVKRSSLLGRSATLKLSSHSSASSPLTSKDGRLRAAQVKAGVDFEEEYCCCCCMGDCLTPSQDTTSKDAASMVGVTKHRIQHQRASHQITFGKKSGILAGVGQLEEPTCKSELQRELLILKRRATIMGVRPPQPRARDATNDLNCHFRFNGQQFPCCTTNPSSVSLKPNTLLPATRLATQRRQLPITVQRPQTRRSLPVPPPVVPLYKEAALFGCCPVHAEQTAEGAAAGGLLSSTKSDCLLDDRELEHQHQHQQPTDERKSVIENKKESTQRQNYLQHHKKQVILKHPDDFAQLGGKCKKEEANKTVVSFSDDETKEKFYCDNWNDLHESSCLRSNNSALKLRTALSCVDISPSQITAASMASGPKGLTKKGNDNSIQLNLQSEGRGFILRRRTGKLLERLKQSFLANFSGQLQTAATTTNHLSNASLVNNNNNVILLNSSLVHGEGSCEAEDGWYKEDGKEEEEEGGSSLIQRNLENSSGRTEIEQASAQPIYDTPEFNAQRRDKKQAVRQAKPAVRPNMPPPPPPMPQTNELPQADEYFGNSSSSSNINNSSTDARSKSDAELRSLRARVGVTQCDCVEANCCADEQIHTTSTDCTSAASSKKPLPVNKKKLPWFDEFNEDHESEQIRENKIKRTKNITTNVQAKTIETLTNTNNNNYYEHSIRGPKDCRKEKKGQFTSCSYSQATTALKDNQYFYSADNDENDQQKCGTAGKGNRKAVRWAINDNCLREKGERIVLNDNNTKKPPKRLISHDGNEQKLFQHREIIISNITNPKDYKTKQVDKNPYLDSSQASLVANSNVELESEEQLRNISSTIDRNTGLEAAGELAQTQTKINKTSTTTTTTTTRAQLGVNNNLGEGREKEAKLKKCHTINLAKETAMGGKQSVEKLACETGASSERIIQSSDKLSSAKNSSGSKLDVSSSAGSDNNNNSKPSDSSIKCLVSMTSKLVGHHQQQQNHRDKEESTTPAATTLPSSNDSVNVAHPSHERMYIQLQERSVTKEAPSKKISNNNNNNNNNNEDDKLNHQTSYQTSKKTSSNTPSVVRLLDVGSLVKLATNSAAVAVAATTSTTTTKISKTLRNSNKSSRAATNSTRGGARISSTPSIIVEDSLEKRKKSIQNGDVFIYPSLYKDLNECSKCSRDNRICNCNNLELDQESIDEENTIHLVGQQQHEIDDLRKINEIDSPLASLKRDDHQSLMKNSFNLKRSQFDEQRQNDNYNSIEEGPQVKMVYKISIATASIDQKSNLLRLSTPTIILPAGGGLEQSSDGGALMVDAILKETPEPCERSINGQQKSILAANDASNSGGGGVISSSRSVNSKPSQASARDLQTISTVVDPQQKQNLLQIAADLSKTNNSSRVQVVNNQQQHSNKNEFFYSPSIKPRSKQATKLSEPKSACTTTNSLLLLSPNQRREFNYKIENENETDLQEESREVEAKVTAIAIGSPVRSQELNFEKLLPSSTVNDDYDEQQSGCILLNNNNLDEVKPTTGSLNGNIHPIDNNNNNNINSNSHKRLSDQTDVNPSEIVSRTELSNIDCKAGDQQSLTCKLSVGDSIKITSTSIRIAGQLSPILVNQGQQDQIKAKSSCGNQVNQTSSSAPIQTLSSRRRKGVGRLSRQAIHEDEDDGDKESKDEYSSDDCAVIAPKSSQRIMLTNPINIGAAGGGGGGGNVLEELTEVASSSDVLEYSPILTSVRDYIETINTELKSQNSPVNDEQLTITSHSTMAPHENELTGTLDTPMKQTQTTTLAVCGGNEIITQTTATGTTIIQNVPFKAGELESPKKSIFDGASKDEILEYLEDARERVPEILMAADDVMVISENELIVVNQLDPGSPATPIQIVEENEMLETSAPSVSPNCLNQIEPSKPDTPSHPEQLRKHLHHLYQTSQLTESSQFSSDKDTMDEDTGIISDQTQSGFGSKLESACNSLDLTTCPSATALQDSVKTNQQYSALTTIVPDAIDTLTQNNFSIIEYDSDTSKRNLVQQDTTLVNPLASEPFQLGGVHTGNESYYHLQADVMSESQSDILMCNKKKIVTDTGSSYHREPQLSSHQTFTREQNMAPESSSISKTSSNTSAGDLVVSAADNNSAGAHLASFNPSNMFGSRRNSSSDSSSRRLRSANGQMIMLQQLRYSNRDSLSSSSSSPPSSTSPSSSTSSNQTSGNCSATSTFYASSSLSCSSPLLGLSNITASQSSAFSSSNNNNNNNIVNSILNGQSFAPTSTSPCSNLKPLTDYKINNHTTYSSQLLDSLVKEAHNSGVLKDDSAEIDCSINRPMTVGRIDGSNSNCLIETPNQDGPRLTTAVGELEALNSRLQFNKMEMNEQQKLERSPSEINFKSTETTTFDHKPTFDHKLTHINKETELNSVLNPNSKLSPNAQQVIDKNTVDSNYQSSKINNLATKLYSQPPNPNLSSSSSNLVTRNLHGHYATSNRLNNYFMNRHPLSNTSDSTIEFQCLDCDQFIDVDHATMLTKKNELRLLQGADNLSHQLPELVNGKGQDYSRMLTPDQLDRAYIAAMNGLPLCKSCEKKRIERKEIISEFVETELKYGRDLKIIHDEFYRPMQIAGLLSKDQISGVFLNLEELIIAHCRYASRLQLAIGEAHAMGDTDYNTVSIGRIFVESAEMLHAFESYCIRQASAACLFARLAKEKELLRIFLRVSQMENTLLRRMNLAAFLMVPVQRVTKYPLLLNRLYKVTAYHHKDREALRDAQLKVELHLEHINQQTKGVGATNKIWRRISNLSAPMTNRRGLINADDIGYIKLRKTAMDMLKWDRDETQFIHSGKLNFAPLNEYLIKQKMKPLRYIAAHALLIVLGKPNWKYRPDLVKSNLDNKLMIPTPGGNGIKETALLLFREKNGRFVPCREPLFLSNCVFCTDCSVFNSEYPLNQPNHHSLKSSSSSSASNSAGPTGAGSGSGSGVVVPPANSNQVSASGASFAANSTRKSISTTIDSSRDGSTDLSSIISDVVLSNNRQSPASLREPLVEPNNEYNTVNSISGDTVSVSSLKSLPEEHGSVSSSPPSNAAHTSRSYSLASALPKTIPTTSTGSTLNLHKSSSNANSSNLTILNQLMTKVNSYHKQSTNGHPKGAGSHSSSPSEQSGKNSPNICPTTNGSSTNSNAIIQAQQNTDVTSCLQTNSTTDPTPITNNNNRQAANLSQQQCNTNNGTGGVVCYGGEIHQHYSHHYFHNHHQPYGDYEESFEIHERLSKESMLLRADTPLKTRYWLQMLRYHAKDLGQWRVRRNGLANIMMMTRQE